MKEMFEVCPNCNGRGSIIISVDIDDNIKEKIFEVQCLHCRGIGKVDWIKFIVLKNST